MLILSPTEAAVGIGAKCGGQAPTDDDAGLISILNYITPRVEDALNVKSLVRTTNRDKFDVICPRSGACGDKTLLLTNAFLVTASIVVTGPDATAIPAYTDGADGTTYEVDAELGTIILKNPYRGTFYVDYASGFEPRTNFPDPQPEPLPLPDVDIRVLKDTPMWMRGIAIDVLVNWYRTTMISPSIPSKVSFGQLSRQLDKDLYSRIYGRYMRPRVDVIFGERRG